MAYRIDTTKFQAEGVILRWPVIARRLGMLEAGRKLPTVLQLRWNLSAELGLPTEPFIVWRRNRKQHTPIPINAEINFSGLFGSSYIVNLRDTFTHVTLVVTSTGGVITGFVGSPQVATTVALAAIPAGTNQQVHLTGSAIEGLTIPRHVSVLSISGVRAHDLAATDGWERLELVGLPVDKDDWAGAGLGKHGTDQGLFGAFTDAVSAAKSRLQRGAPPLGWSPVIEAGLPAPIWNPPLPDAYLSELRSSLLVDLRKIASLPPMEHAAKKIVKVMPPPENSLGQRMSRPDRESEVAPLSMTYMVAGIDCFGSLALGFGTAYPEVLQARQPAVQDFDYMITARYEHGASGHDAPVDYAALVPAPPLAIAPPIPAAMKQEMMGNLRPIAADGAWRASVRVSWDRPVPIPLFRPRSFAFARAGVNPLEPASLLMKQRTDGSAVMIGINYYSNANDPKPNRVSAVEREIPIPNPLGTRTLKYAAAHQDIYGQWSNWVAVNSTVTQPDIDDVRIVSAEFQFTNVTTPPQSKCATRLVIEFLWDWRVRSPLTISFRGRLYSAAYHGAPPPDTSLPNGLQTKLGGSITTTFTLGFDVLAFGGTPTSSWPGYNLSADCLALNPEGDQVVPFGAAQGGDARRYRVTITGFELDFAATGHIGFALWGRGQEAIPPQRLGDWSGVPTLISVSDPRPPLIVPDIVTLSSLPDAAGESHAALNWSGSPGADGYFIYESTETKLLKSVGKSEPDPALTLSERLTAALGIFDDNPTGVRAEFTRRNSRLLKATSADLTLPRGSTTIHLFAVLGVSAGQVEAIWPESSAALYAFAVPRMPQPAAPTLETARVLDDGSLPHVFRTRIRIGTGKGPRVRRIDLHRVRVDDAARELDTMGPPIFSIDGMSSGWDVTQSTDALGIHLVSAMGTDTPTPSWKRVWYRAVAWSDDDPIRGILSARSTASSAAWVVVPPTTPPDLSPLTFEWPGTSPPDVVVTWSSTAPINKTPLGSHQIAIRARRIGAAPDESPLISFDGPLSAIPFVQPATGSGAWRVADSIPPVYQAIVRRADVSDAVELSVRITDPLGRTSEAIGTIKSGHILPDPVLADFVLSTSTAPPGSELFWSSTTPIDSEHYVLRVTVSRPPFIIGTLSIRRPPISVQSGLADVVVDEPGPVPSGSDAVRVRRMPGPGPSFLYYAFVRVPFTQIAVRLEAADGRFAEHLQNPS